MFGEVESMRHDLMHKGEFRRWAAYHERLIHLYFWDIVIHQIGLKPRGLAALLQHVPTGVNRDSQSAPIERV
jgi:hypothetical protein